MFNSWTGTSLLRAALNKLTPENWTQDGDFREYNEITDVEKVCIVGMCANILNTSDEDAENFLRTQGLPVHQIEKANDEALNLVKFEMALRDKLGIAF
jgi:hypothetical protein